jgi:predicted regulator of Ras-like GTPase activity (Roadblock/LC7/MglB family)
MLRTTLRGLLEQSKDLAGVAVVGADGIPLDSVMSPGLDGSLLGAEFADIVRGLQSRLADAKMGALNGLTVETDGHRILFEPVASGYFLIGVVAATGILGRARFALKRSLHALASELT